MRKEQKLVLGFVATLAGVVGTLSTHCSTVLCCVAPPRAAVVLSGREALQKLMRQHALCVFILLFSMGIQAHERAGVASKDDQEKAKRSASMWKNMDKKARE
ncbi:hypothetical protein FI667_g5704, partial [Globisporangium splendens]